MAINHQILSSWWVLAGAIAAFVIGLICIFIAFKDNKSGDRGKVYVFGALGVILCLIGIILGIIFIVARQRMAQQK